MQIYVCVKHVPDSAASITITNGASIEQNIAFMLNPFDEHAITEAVKIRDSKIKKGMSDSEVIAICLGPDDAQKTLQSSLAMGADRGILIQTSKNHDSIVTAKALKAAMNQDGNPGLILTGKESIDIEGMQTMFRIGALFDYPVVNNIVKLDVEDDDVIVEYELSNGMINTCKMRLPSVLGTGKGLNTPKYPTFPDIVKARKKLIKTIFLTDLNIKTSSASMTVVKLAHLHTNRTPEEIKGTTVQAAEQILQILEQQAKVLS